MLSEYNEDKPIQVAVDNLPISRIMMLARYQKDFNKAKTLLALFHDELLLTDIDDDTNPDVLTARAFLKSAYEGIEEASKAIDSLQAFLEQQGTSTTFLAFTVKQANAKKSDN